MKLIALGAAWAATVTLLTSSNLTRGLPVAEITLLYTAWWFRHRD